jgi:glyoxylase-like metal-dependent hydrolase (beta-lactamase superfamily II)
MTKLRLLFSAFTCVLVLPTLAWSADLVRTADIAKRDLTVDDFPRWKELAPNVYSYADLLTAGGTTLTTVSLIVVTSDGVVLVDGQDTIEQGEALLENIKKITSQPVKYNVIASDHGDHVNSNPAIQAAYPDVVFISSPVSQKLLADEDRPPVPTEVVADKRTLSLGGTDIEILNLGRGHTGGDLVAYLPESKVLFLGELYLHQVFPAMVTAYPSEWVATIKKAQAMDVTWFVPGHGFVDDAVTLKAGLNDALKATEHVIAEAKRLRAAGQACASEEDCPAAQHAKWGPYRDWTLFDSQSARALARVYKEIEGKLP